MPDLNERLNENYLAILNGKGELGEKITQIHALMRIESIVLKRLMDANTAGIALSQQKQDLQAELLRLESSEDLFDNMGQRFNCEARIRKVTAALEANYKEVLSYIDLLSSGDESIKSQLISATTQDLKSLHEETQKKLEAMVHCLSIAVRIQENHENLGKIAELENRANTFLKRHDDIVVKISLFLSKWILSFFKTKKAASVEDVRDMHAALQEKRDTYNTKLLGIIDGLKEIPAVSPTVKDKISDLSQIPVSVAPSVTANDYNEAFTELKDHYDMLLGALDDDEQSTFRPGVR